MKISGNLSTLIGAFILLSFSLQASAGGRSPCAPVNGVINVSTSGVCTSLREALTAANSAAIIFIAPGTYDLAGRYFPYSVSIIGAGSGLTKIRTLDGLAAQSFCSCSGVDGKISGVTISALNPGALYHYGLELGGYGAQNFEVSDVVIENFDIGIRILNQFEVYGPIKIKIVNSEIKGNNTGLYYANLNYGVAGDDVAISHTKLIGNVVNDINIDNQTINNFTGQQFPITVALNFNTFDTITAGGASPVTVVGQYNLTSNSQPKLLP